MVEKMHEMEDRISRRVDRRIDRLETRLVDRVDRRVEKLETRMLSLLRQHTASFGDSTSPQSANPSNQGTSPPVPGGFDVSFPDIKQADLKASASDSEDDELSIPIDHTTGAHNLLSWPTVRRLIGTNITENYVMEIELGRGKIRLDEYDEGPTTVGEWSDPGQARTMASNRPSTNSRNDAGPSSSADWATGRSSSFSGQPREPVGGLDEFGHLNTDPDVVRRLVLSYLSHMHILHPFLDESHLRNMMEQFIRLYGRPRERPAHPVQAGVEIPRGLKRKRSLQGVQMAGYEANPLAGSSPTPLRIEESIENAILLLVMAVGAICEWRDRPLPPAAYDTTPSTKPPSARVLPPELSSGASFFRRPSASSSTPESSGRRASVVSDSSRRRNVDVIPGFAYYAYGVRIIGPKSMFTTLEEAQAGLLAGLYMGQLADPVESFGWIKRAADACIVLTRKYGVFFCPVPIVFPPKEPGTNESVPRDNYQSLPKGRHKSLCEFAYWTNLQLESDILAELPLPGSGITKVETQVQLPSGDYVFPVPNSLDAPNTRMMVFYLAQIHLRKVLNRIHNDLYKTPSTCHGFSFDLSSASAPFVSGSIVLTRVP